jgi:hypothetical protein
LYADARYPNINLTGYFVIDVFLSKLFGTGRHHAKSAEFNSPRYAAQAGLQECQSQTASAKEREQGNAILG